VDEHRNRAEARSIELWPRIRRTRIPADKTRQPFDLDQLSGGQHGFERIRKLTGRFRARRDARTVTKAKADLIFRLPVTRQTY
jgi:hypothetical protein